MLDSRRSPRSSSARATAPISASNLAIARVDLDADDDAAIDRVLARARPLEGDVYALERDRTSRHGSIMKYDLNKGAA